MSLRLDWATHQAAKFACENWHYSKSLPVPPLVKIGVWEENAFIGVVIFSRGANNNLLKPYGLTHYQGCELTRVALKKHKSPVSKIISIAIKLLKKTNKNLKLIVSFADPNENHHGGIYQAGNWIYSGRTDKIFKYIDASGREWHQRQVSKKGFKVWMGNLQKTVSPENCKKIVQMGKHRYLMPLDEETKKKILRLSQKYPKRASSKDSVASTYQVEEGGANPTDALH